MAEPEARPSLSGTERWFALGDEISLSAEVAIDGEEPRPSKPRLGLPAWDRRAQEAVALVVLAIGAFGLVYHFISTRSVVVRAAAPPPAASAAARSPAPPAAATEPAEARPAVAIVAAPQPTSKPANHHHQKEHAGVARAKQDAKTPTR
jgi:hypothetical protein